MGKIAGIPVVWILAAVAFYFLVVKKPSASAAGDYPVIGSKPDTTRLIPIETPGMQQSLPTVTDGNGLIYTGSVPRYA